jgi:lipopolysaccharide transport system ATP-binding protein
MNFPSIYEELFYKGLRIRLVEERITEPTEGQAEIHGRVGSLLEVGTGFHPELTGRENIFLNGAILGMKKTEIDRKFDEIVAFAEIEKFLDTPVKHYSSGMYVRLAFAVAAHLEPEILLVDEVLAVGDAAFQKKCLGKMEDVSREGRTVLFVSHNMFSLQNLCNRGILLESGQIAMQGGITDVINKYLSSGREQSGEVCWDSPGVAPSNERVRLKAVRVVSEDGATADVDISKELRIEVDYWNLEADRRRLVSVHLHNSMGICVLTSSNMASASLTPDPWYSRRYPIGLFRTSCTIPGCLLNDGLHSITIYVNEKGASDNIIIVRDVLSFTVQDTGLMPKEYTGKWIGAVRPRLNWQTTQLS